MTAFQGEEKRKKSLVSCRRKKINNAELNHSESLKTT